MTVVGTPPQALNEFSVKVTENDESSLGSTTPALAEDDKIIAGPPQPKPVLCPSRKVTVPHAGLNANSQLRTSPKSFQSPINDLTPLPSSTIVTLPENAEPNCPGEVVVTEYMPAKVSSFGIPKLLGTPSCSKLKLEPDLVNFARTVV